MCKSRLGICLKEIYSHCFLSQPEFIRDWIFINNSVAVDENIIAAAIGLHKDESRFLKYTLRSFCAILFTVVI
ncbi:MAG: hypothetical protein IPP29_03960 [Bacteroidetes bacterium]|nr:hypothetical protein [Bacteroidota bacterium]